LLVLGNDQLFSVCLYCYRLFRHFPLLWWISVCEGHYFTNLGFLSLSASMPSKSTLSSPFRERLVLLHIFVLVCWSFLVVEEENMGLDERVWCYKAQVLTTLKVFRLSCSDFHALRFRWLTSDAHLCLYWLLPSCFHFHFGLQHSSYFIMDTDSTQSTRHLFAVWDVALADDLDGSCCLLRPVAGVKNHGSGPPNQKCTIGCCVLANKISLVSSLVQNWLIDSSISLWAS
jgi:hypothetical protein